MSITHIPAALRRRVVERASGQCEYCLIPDTVAFSTHVIDHVVAEKHGGATEADNLALSCVLCNRYKGTDLASLDPLTSQLTPLYHPRRDRWANHFELTGAELRPLTAVGRVTVRLLQLNRPERLAEREELMAAGALKVPR